MNIGKIYDKIQDGWFAVKYAETRIGLIDGAEIKAVTFLRKHEKYIDSDTMLDRAQYEFDLAFGLEDARCVHHYQKNIPEKLRRYRLIFPGTIWRGKDGRYISSLAWKKRAKEWTLEFIRCDNQIHSSNERLISISGKKRDDMGKSEHEPWNYPTFPSRWNTDCDLW